MTGAQLYLFGKDRWIAGSVWATCRERLRGIVLEREMEDLIAEHPNEFFPRHRFTLQGRQGNFHEFGRYDLLFVDEFGTQVLMELKAVPAKYENATQLARYSDALREKNTGNVQMWLVAPSIPRSIRDFLDQIGIEYTEIHEAEFRKVAARNGYAFASEGLIAPTDSLPPGTKTVPKASRGKVRQEVGENVDVDDISRSLPCRQNAVLSKCLRKYVDSPFRGAWVKAHRVTQEMHSNRIVSYAYIQHNTANITCFRKAAYPSQALKRCIEDALLTGVISRVEGSHINSGLYMIQVAD